MVKFVVIVFFLLLEKGDFFEILSVLCLKRFGRYIGGYFKEARIFRGVKGA